MTENETLFAGYARTEITPKESVPLIGFGNAEKRMSNWVRDPLYASCIAVTDSEENTLLLFSLDLARIPRSFLDPVRQDIAGYYGVPADHMIFSCIRTQSGLDACNEMDCMQRYLRDLAVTLPALAGLALADRRPAKLSMGDVETEGMNFVRHYKAVPEDGEPFYFSDNFNNDKLTAGQVQRCAVHVTDADPTLHVLCFTRDYCKDLVVANFRCRPVLVGSAEQTFVTADSIGDFRTAAERRGDVDFVFFQGAAGNVDNKSRIFAEMATQDSVVWGDIMTDYLLRAMRNLETVEAAPIRTKQILLEGKGSPAADALELNAVTLGDVAFVSVPGELFDTQSVYVEDNAPFRKVLTLGYANDYVGYIPSKFAYEYTCYESGCSPFAAGIGETVAQAFVDMLTELKGEEQ